MKVYVLVHNGEANRFYNLKTKTLQDKMTIDCLGEFSHINGILRCWGPHRDDRYACVGFTLRSIKKRKKN